MHSGEGLVQVRDDLSRLLIRYRAASLEVLEDMMRHPQLEPIADALLRRKVRKSYKKGTHNPAYMGFDLCVNPSAVSTRYQTLINILLFVCKRTIKRER